MNVNCPHCSKTIELVGPSELKAEYGWTAAMIQHNRTIPGFPEPVLKFANRHIYLRADVDRWVEQRSRANVEKAVESLMRNLEFLPEKERHEAEQILQKRLEEDGGHHSGRKTPTNGRRRKR